MNLDWIDPDQSPENENKAFEKAMALAGNEFLDVRFLKINKWSFKTMNLGMTHFLYSLSASLTFELLLNFRVFDFMQNHGYQHGQL